MTFLLATAGPSLDSARAQREEPAEFARAPLWAGVSLGCLVCLGVTLAVALGSGTANQAGWRLFVPLALAWLVFAAAFAALRRTSRRTALALVLTGGIGLQVVAVAFPPRLTDDYFRYAWDGQVQAAGIDPYRYAPTDPALAPLRQDWLFPPGCRHTVPPCTRMNHPTDRTIYPPVAEATFLAVHVLTLPVGQDGGRDVTWQLLGATLAIATTLALWRVLRSRGDPRQAALWAWCPTVVLECGNNGHIDAFAALLVVLALGAAAAGRWVRAGAAIGAAIGTKILPVLVLPALLASPPGHPRARRTARLLTAALAVLVAGYLPHVIAVGGDVLGFLPEYLTEEGYQGHSRYGLLRLFLPGTAAAVVAGLALVGLAALVSLRADPSRPWEAAVVMVGGAFVMGGITYPWYAVLLVALIALDGRWEWLAVAAATYPGYLSTALHLPWTTTQQASYLAVVFVLALAGVLRHARSVGRRGSDAGLSRDRCNWPSG